MNKRALQPVVSVIIPVFNDAHGLLACLDGLARQTLDPSRFEAIVVDNGSTPPVTVPNSFPFALHLLRELKPGSYAARNAGIRAANGSIFAFTDADCVPEPNWLLAGVDKLGKGQGHEIIGGAVNIVPSNKSGTALYQWLLGFRQEENIRIRGFSVTANLFCTQEQLTQVGTFDDSLLSAGDLEWCWRGRQHGYTVTYVPEAAVTTPTRSSLSAAIRQARRVEGGRRQLRHKPSVKGFARAVERKYSSLQGLQMILFDGRIGPVAKMRVIAVAITIRIATLLERLRLARGAAAERT